MLKITRRQIVAVTSLSETVPYALWFHWHISENANKI